MTSIFPSTDSRPERHTMKRSAVVLSTVALASGFVAVTALPAQATPDTTEVVWLLPETVTSLPTSNTPAIWPQEYLPDGVVPCGRFGQADVYNTADVAALIADGVLAEGEDYSVVISWRFIDGGECAPPVDPCPVDFTAQNMWEVTWGYSFEDRNGGTPVFDMQSNGGLTGLNGGPVPAYMAADWHWLYITKAASSNKVTTYQFADGTERSVTVTGAEGCPEIVWAVTPPVVEPVVVPPVVEPLPPALPLTEVPTLAHTGPTDATPLIALGGLGSLLVAAGAFLIRRRWAA